MHDTVQDLGVAAAERALSILRAFTAEQPTLNLTEIAARTGLYKSTVLRFLVSLERHGFIVRISDGDYRLGPMLLHLGNLYQRSFRLEDHVVPVLQSLMHETGESAAFHVRDEKARICLFRVDSKHPIRDHIQVGDVIPLSKGAAGRVLTTFQNGPDESQRLPFVSIGELAPDAAGIAVPVFGPHNHLAGALVLTGPTTRFTKVAIAKMGRVLIRAGKALTAEIGGDMDSFHPHMLEGNQRARKRAAR